MKRTALLVVAGLTAILASVAQTVIASAVARSNDYVFIVDGKIPLDPKAFCGNCWDPEE
jgi:hypothetical protein